MFRIAAKYFTIIALVLFIVNWGWASMLNGINFKHNFSPNEIESAPGIRLDSDSLPYAFRDRYGDP